MYRGLHMSEDEYWDAVQEARREELDDHHNARCVECGETWDMCWTRGNRVDPPEPRVPECPACGGDAVDL